MAGNSVVIGDPILLFGVCAAILAAAMSTAGIVTVASAGDWARRNSAYVAAFAVGLLSASIYLHLLPEAAAASKNRSTR